jgi:hypothetical protein
MFRVRRKSQTTGTPGGPERLPLRWGVILIAAGAAGAAAFTVGGAIAALGAACLVASTLHKVLA